MNANVLLKGCVYICTYIPFQFSMIRSSHKRLDVKYIQIFSYLFVLCNAIVCCFLFFCFFFLIRILFTIEKLCCYYSPHRRPNSVAFGFRHDDVHNKDFHPDENILNPLVIPCKHNKQNRQDANRPESQDVEQKPQYHRRKVGRCTEIKHKKYFK